MAVSIRDKATDAAVRKLARIKSKGLTQTVREAVENELERSQPDMTPLVKVEKLGEQYRSFPRTGLVADKAFYDSLNDE